MKTREEFVAYVRQLESFAERSPGSYRIRLGLLAALGYAYLLLLLAVCLGVVAGMVLYGIETHRFNSAEIRLTIFLLILVYFILRSIWVRLERPQGIPLQPADTPSLFPLIEDLRTKLNAPRLHHVLLTDDYNAAVVQLPRFGILGSQQNYLLLGLPLMQSLGPDEFRAVLAHELGHVSANHGSFAVWIWRVRETWSRLTEQLQHAQHRGTFLVNWFSKWYAPRLMAYSFALVRSNEREADRYAAQLSTPDAAARALAALAVRARGLGEKFWPDVYRQVNDQPSPPTDTCARQLDAVRQPLDAAQADVWLREALAAETRYDDSHPALRERLAAFGYLAALDDEAERRALLPGEPGITAADLLIGDRLPAYAERLGQLWAETIKENWAGRHAEAQGARARLAELAARAESQPPSQGEAWERVHLTYEFVSEEAARPLVAAVLEKWPDFPPAQLTYGCLLLDQGNDAGLKLIDRAMEMDSDLVLSGCEAAYEFLRRKGQDHLAEAYWDRAEKRSDELHVEVKEKTVFTKRDRFLPHEAPAAAVEDIRRLVEAEDEVREAYLVRKELRSRPGSSVQVLGIVPRFKRGFWRDPDTAAAALTERLVNAGSAPLQMVVIVIAGRFGGPFRFLRKRMAHVEGALIYKRDGKR